MPTSSGRARIAARRLVRGVWVRDAVAGSATRQAPSWLQLVDQSHAEGRGASAPRATTRALRRPSPQPSPPPPTPRSAGVAHRLIGWRNVPHRSARASAAGLAERDTNAARHRCPNSGGGGTRGRTSSHMCLLPPSLGYDFQDYPTMAEGGSIMDRMWASGGSRRALVEGAVLIGSGAVLGGWWSLEARKLRLVSVGTPITIR